MQEPWVGKIPWRRKWQPTPVLLPGKSHGLRSLVGYSPWGCKESDTTERLHFTSSYKFLIFLWREFLRPGFPGGTVIKNLPANAGAAGDLGSTPVSERSPGGGNGSPLQSSCLGNPTDRGAWQATVHRVAKNRTWLSNWAHRRTRLIGPYVRLVNSSLCLPVFWSGHFPY